MKRIGFLYSQIYDMENLRLAHHNAKKGKGWYHEVKMIDENPDKYLTILQNMLIDHTYQTSEYETFIKKEIGKERVIYKLPYFPDRVCQWAILQVIEPYLLKYFTGDTYSAIPGKGIHKCLHKVDHAIQSDPEGTTYCLKIDARKFYPSIDHTILKEKYRRLFKDPELLGLLDEIIDSTEGETGIPIGNYLSQYSGNFYLAEFDHWIKEVKRVKHYYRYMDDIVIFSDLKADLHRLRVEIDTKFCKIKLTIKDNWQVFPTAVRGVDFVGYRVFPGYKLLRKSTCKEMEHKMRLIRKKHEEGHMISYSEYCAVNSYLGWMKHCDSYRLQEKYIKPLRCAIDRYYELNLKGGKTNDRTRCSSKYCKTSRT